MKTLISRSLALAVLAVTAWLLLAGAASKSSSTTPLQPDKLIILSTNDVKGKTSPCG